MRLKPNEVPAYRLKLLKQQDFICPLCLTKIEPHEAALDHDHKTGHCRAVLHKSCNASEGKILGWCKRSRGNDPVLFLEQLIKHWTSDHRHKPHHPNHLTEKEKKIKKLKTKLKTLKSERGKQKVRDLIRRIQDESSV